MTDRNRWRRSASVIIVAPDDTPADASPNYKVLTFDRVESSSSYPGATVFPGGMLEKSDMSQEWLKLYNSFGFNIDSFKCIRPKIDLAIYKSENTNEMPCYLSLRIAAIREVFEETCILMCRSSKVHYEENSCWVNCILRDDLVAWQNKVSNDSSEFINFCKQFDMYPDVWSLHEWSNWASPPFWMYNKYDVVFYLTALQKVPFTSKNIHEATELQWASAQEYLQLYKNEKIVLLLPQFYEISRLKVFSRIEDLAKFAQKRASYGTQTFISHRLFTDDYACSILPGDDLYPLSRDQIDENNLHVESVPDTKVQHRIYSTSLHDNNMVVKNYKPLYNHVVPLNSKM